MSNYLSPLESAKQIYKTECCDALVVQYMHQESPSLSVKCEGCGSIVFLKEKVKKIKVPRKERKWYGIFGGGSEITEAHVKEVVNLVYSPSKS